MNDEWTELTPKLSLQDTAMEILHSVVRELEQIALDDEEYLENISKVRERYLAQVIVQCVEERQIARVWISVLCDLRAQWWQFRLSGVSIMAKKPQPIVGSPAEEKARVRAGLLLERDAQLRSPAIRRFVTGMERRRLGPNGWTSIFSLMRDGRELADGLQEASVLAIEGERESKLAEITDPYVQVVDDSICIHTGIALKDIWRYFRYTWVNSPKSVPGRNVWFLIRDRACENHPVIGIGAIGSAIVQLRQRDAWIGWRHEEFLERLSNNPTEKWASWVYGSLDTQISEIFLEDFVADGVLKAEDLTNPTRDLVQSLRTLSVEEMKNHRRSPEASEHKSSSYSDEEWKKKAQSYLFRSKRASALASLLEARLNLQKAGFFSPSAGALAEVLKSSGGRTAIRKILRSVKATHVGIDMMDITVCGAVPPYNPILGGKLVSLLMASSEVVKAYEERYSNAASIIASSMAGKTVQRRPQLVFLGTTSLYASGSSQYNRVRIPAEEVGGPLGEEIRYHQLGETEGYGSFHFSSDTLNEFEALWSQNNGARRVNSIFGEGVNPRLRKIRDALDSVGFDSEFVLMHGDRRIVYGIPLAVNFREVLLGLEDEAQYILPKAVPGEASRRISAYWVKRWLSKRIEQPRFIEAVARHTLAYPVDHGARVRLPDEYSDMPLLSD